MDDQNYESSGFDGFLSRSVDGMPQLNLDSPSNPSRSIPFDRGQQSGFVSDQVRLGDLYLNGKDGQLSLLTDGNHIFDLGNLTYGPGLGLRDNNNIRFLAGTDRKGDIKIKLSQAGYDADTATDEQLIWSSDFNTFKIVGESPTGTQAPSVTTVSDGTNTNSGFATNSYPHNLGYTPFIVAWVETSASQYTLMPYSEVVSASDPSGGIISSIFRVTADSANVSIFHYVVTYSPGIGTGTYAAQNVKYFLLRQTAPAS